MSANVFDLRLTWVLVLSRIAGKDFIVHGYRGVIDQITIREPARPELIDISFTKVRPPQPKEDA